MICLLNWELWMRSSGGKIDMHIHYVEILCLQFHLKGSLIQSVYQIKRALHRSNLSSEMVTNQEAKVSIQVQSTVCTQYNNGIKKEIRNEVT